MMGTTVDNTIRPIAGGGNIDPMAEITVDNFPRPPLKCEWCNKEFIPFWDLVEDELHWRMFFCDEECHTAALTY